MNQEYYREIYGIRQEIKFMNLNENAYNTEKISLYCHSSIYGIVLGQKIRNLKLARLLSCKSVVLVDKDHLLLDKSIPGTKFPVIIFVFVFNAFPFFFHFDA